MLACVLMLLGASAGVGNPVPELSYEITRELPVPADELRLPLARVSVDGEVYLADAMTARVWALGPNGNIDWEVQLAPERLRSSIRSIELDQHGHLFLLEAMEMAVHVLETATGRTLSRVQVAGLGAVPTLGAIAADGEGGFFVPSHRDRVTINRFDRAGRLAGELERGSRVDSGGMLLPKAVAWIGRGSNGYIYVRAEEEFAFFQLDARDGRVLSRIAPVVPFVLQTDSRRPADTVFASAVLPDGRIVAEVTHRRALDRDASGAATRVALDNVLYVINPDGTLSGVLRLPLKGLGQFAAVGPGGSLYFVTTRQTVEPGERPRIQVVNLK